MVREQKTPPRQTRRQRGTKPGQQRRPHSAERLCTATSEEETHSAERRARKAREDGIPHSAERLISTIQRRGSLPRAMQERKVWSTREGKQRVTVTVTVKETRRERDTRIEDTPAVLNEPTDHATARGRDVSLRYEGGHSPENRTNGVGVVLETTDGPQRQRTSQTSPHSQQNTLL